MMSEDNARNPGRFSAIGLLCYMWLIVGFVLGTIVLVFPVRWLTDGLHRAGASPLFEKLSVGALVLAYVVASFFRARRLARTIHTCKTRRLGWGIAAGATVCAAATAWAWTDPGLLLAGAAGGGSIQSVATAHGATFEFGAYP